MTISDNLTLLNSTKADIKAAIEAKGVTMTDVAFTDYDTKIGEISGSGSLNTWVRNPTWPAISTPAGTQKVMGLYAVYPNDPNFFAVYVVGAYTVDFGDGTSTNTASGVLTYKMYDYTSAALAGTDGPVTFTDSTDTVNRTSHGYKNDMEVSFYNIVSTTGIVSAAKYFVINATTNTFQISTTKGGSAVSLTTDGSATLLPYKIATVTITPQSGQNLTTIDLYRKHSSDSLRTTGAIAWLDVSVAASSCTTLAIGGSTTNLYQVYCEHVNIVELGAITTFSYLFGNMLALRKVEITANTSNVTSTGSMFNNCENIESVPYFDTSNVTFMGGMFFGCSSLQEIPTYNTSKLISTGASSMFLNCSSLNIIPFIDTSKCTSLASMFSGCNKLTVIPTLNTANVTSITSMFSNCWALENIPALNFTSVTGSTASFVSNCMNLSRMQITNMKVTFTLLNCKLSSTALDEVYTNLGTVTGQTITVTGNHGNTADNPAIATAKGWSVVG